MLLLRLLSVPGAAQQNHEKLNGSLQATHQDSKLRVGAENFYPLTRDEGLAVLGAALDSRQHRGFASDCSHFVQGLYQRAGFSYTYASSIDIYSGIDQFQRVTTPQAGDLVAWRGHVGVVVNPVQHSFFSLLRSGPGVESYDSAYWRRRGHPRFFRYVKQNPGTGPVTSLRNASLRPGIAEDADSRERTTDDPYATEELSDQSRFPARVTVPQPATPSVPQVVVLNSTHPTPDQVRTAFLESCADSEESLGRGDIFRSDRSLVVFDHFIVRKLHMAGTQGWAEVEIDELVSFTAGRSDVRSHSERQRWPLIRRARSTWELSLPQRTIYLPQNIAAHITAQQLAQLTRDTASNSDKIQKIELAQLLNVLLQK